MSMRVQTSLWYAKLNSFGNITSNEIAGTNSSSIFWKLGYPSLIYPLCCKQFIYHCLAILKWSIKLLLTIVPLLYYQIPVFLVRKFCRWYTLSTFVCLRKSVLPVYFQMLLNIVFLFGNWFFFFQDFIVSSHSFGVCKISAEKSVDYLIEVPLYVAIYIYNI